MFVIGGVFYYKINSNLQICPNLARFKYNSLNCNCHQPYAKHNKFNPCNLRTYLTYFMINLVIARYCLSEVAIVLHKEYNIK